MDEPDWTPALARFRKALRAQVRPGVALRCAAAAESTFRRGASRVGGRPDLPRGFAWPVARELPLAFVAQINLADVARHSDELPAKGLLSFFVLDELRILRALHRTRPEVPRPQRVRVVFTPPRTVLERRELPASLPTSHAIAARKPTFRKVETWPQCEGTAITARGLAAPRGALALDLAAWDAWARAAPAAPPSQLLGHPCGCEFPIGQAPDARLLLALDAKDGGLPWDLCGRNGHLFIGLPGAALAAHDWTQAFHKEW